MQIQSISVTTDSSGAGSGTVHIGAPSYLYKVEYNLGDFAATVDATLALANTVNGTNYTLLTLTDASADTIYYPRHTEVNNAGSALTTYAQHLVHGDVVLTIAQGGDTKTGGMILYLRD